MVVDAGVFNLIGSDPPLFIKNNLFRLVKYTKRGIWGNDFHSKLKYGLTFGINNPFGSVLKYDWTVKLKAPQETFWVFSQFPHHIRIMIITSSSASAGCFRFEVALCDLATSNPFDTEMSVEERTRQTWSLWWIWLHCFVTTMSELLTFDLQQKEEQESPAGE